MTTGGDHGSPQRGPRDASVAGCLSRGRQDRVHVSFLTRRLIFETRAVPAPQDDAAYAHAELRLVAEPLPCSPSHDVKQRTPTRSRAFARGLASFHPPSRGVGGAPRGASSSSSSRRSARVSRAGEARRVRCAWTAKRTLAFRRSTVAFSGRDPAFAGASAGKPASALAAAPFLPRHSPDPEVPSLPRRAVSRRRTPLPAPPSGSSPGTPLDERGCESMYYGCIL
jgi:hypothetical protein